jgi:hypothetical protein
MAVHGDLATSESQDGVSEPERRLVLGEAEFLHPGQCISHHIHNRSSDPGLTIHVSGA